MMRLPHHQHPLRSRRHPVGGHAARHAQPPAAVHYHYHAAPGATASDNRTVGKPPAGKGSSSLLEWIQNNPLLMAIATTLVGALVGSWIQRGFDRAANRKERQDKREELRQLFEQYRTERNEAELLGPDAVQALDREYELIFEAITKG